MPADNQGSRYRLSGGQPPKILKVRNTLDASKFDARDRARLECTHLVRCSMI